MRHGEKVGETKSEGFFCFGMTELDFSSELYNIYNNCSFFVCC